MSRLTLKSLYWLKEMDWLVYFLDFANAEGSFIEDYILYEELGGLDGVSESY